MPYYQKHVFICENQKDPGKQCCQDGDATAMRVYAKQRVKELDPKGIKKIRINKAGCLGRCKLGPVIVVYPDAVWYTYNGREDVGLIIEQHLIGGRVVESLLIKE